MHLFLLYILNNRVCFVVCGLFEIFLQNIIQEYYQSITQFESRSIKTFGRAYPGSNRLQAVISQ